MKKRLLGIQDNDTNDNVDNDFDEKTYPGTK